MEPRGGEARRPGAAMEVWMNRWERGAVAAVALVVSLVGVRAGWAGPPTDLLRVQIDRVVKTLDEPELKREGRARERRVAVRRIAEDIFDFTETAKRSLGRHWQPRTPAERKEFVDLFANLLERSYLSKIELYSGEKISYLGDTVEGDQATVRTRIATRHGTEIPVDYKMYKHGDRWLVYDVIIEGVSLIANYRTQFNKIIQTSSYQELVRKMKTKQAEFSEDQRRALDRG
jgi:phospholipid transport system substrate-binding protein